MGFAIVALLVQTFATGLVKDILGILAAFRLFGRWSQAWMRKESLGAQYERRRNAFGGEHT